MEPASALIIIVKTRYGECEGGVERSHCTRRVVFHPHRVFVQLPTDIEYPTGFIRKDELSA